MSAPLSAWPSLHRFGGRYNWPVDNLPTSSSCEELARSHIFATMKERTLRPSPNPTGARWWMLVLALGFAACARGQDPLTNGLTALYRFKGNADDTSGN